MKLMQYYIFILSIIVSIFLFESKCNSTNEFEYNFILSNGGELQQLKLNDNIINNHKTVLNKHEWADVLYPCINKKNNELFFEAQNSANLISSWIYVINLSDKTYNPRKIVEGQAPSINTIGSMLSYYKHPNELWVFSLENGEKRKIVNDIANSYPAVWYSINDLLYSTNEKKIATINITTGVKKDTGFEGVSPSALSPKGEKVLCSSDARKIYLYSPYNNKLEVVKEFSFISVGSSFVWAPNGDSFLYTRQTLFKLLQINEAHDLFLYSLKTGKEQKMLEYFTLFGGVYIPDKNEE